MNTNPSTIDAALAAGQRFITLANGAYGEIGIRTPGTVLTGSGPSTVARLIRTVGYVPGVTIQNLAVDGGGIQVIDGADHLSVNDVSIENVAGVGLNVTGHDSSPSLNLALNRVRIRKCQIGAMIGQCIRWAVYDLWVDQCQSPTNPNDSAYHGCYFNDANCLAGDIHGMLVTRCGGTSFRGTGTRAYDLIAWQSGVSIAGSQNAEMMTRFTAIDAGAIEINAQGPCVVEDPYGPIYINRRCRSPWLQILRPLLPPGATIQDDAHYPLPDPEVPGRFGTLTEVAPRTVAANDRTPATYCRDMLGGTADLESLWDKPFGSSTRNPNQPFTVANMNRWLRESLELQH